MARRKFDELAFQQAAWQEENSGQDHPEKLLQKERSKHDSAEVERVEPQRVVGTSRELKESAEAAAKITLQAETTKGCLQDATSSKPPELIHLSKLIEYMDHAPRLSSYVPAADMWAASEEAVVAQLGILTTLQACSPYASERKKPRKVASEALQAYRRLTASIAKLDVLALEQTEWEEQNAQKQPIMTEQ